MKKYAEYTQKRTDEVLAELKKTNDWVGVQEGWDIVLRAVVYYLVSKGVIK